MATLLKILNNLADIRSAGCCCTSRQNSRGAAAVADGGEVVAEVSEARFCRHHQAAVAGWVGRGGIALFWGGGGKLKNKEYQRQQDTLRDAAFRFMDDVRTAYRGSVSPRLEAMARYLAEQDGRQPDDLVWGAPGQAPTLDAKKWPWQPTWVVYIADASRAIERFEKFPERECRHVYVAVAGCIAAHGARSRRRPLLISPDRLTRRIRRSSSNTLATTATSIRRGVP
jgi:hypothetical protein